MGQVSIIRICVANSRMNETLASKFLRCLRNVSKRARFHFVELTTSVLSREVEGFVFAFSSCISYPFSPFRSNN